MSLTDTEIVRLENIQLRRENLAMQSRQLRAVEATLVADIESRLNISLKDFQIKPDGTLERVRFDEEAEPQNQVSTTDS